mmetsp:Transcript_33778/g.54044  ORF Transcript_33778/g.54044 Transcript_33778/m.54044 type:complete len:94 (+) Transcript_33778:139-420(+)
MQSTQPPPTAPQLLDAHQSMHQQTTHHLIGNKHFWPIHVDTNHEPWSHQSRSSNLSMFHVWSRHHNCYHKNTGNCPAPKNMYKHHIARYIASQ